MLLYIIAVSDSSFMYISPQNILPIISNARKRCSIHSGEVQRKSNAAGSFSRDWVITRRTHTQQKVWVERQPYTKKPPTLLFSHSEEAKATARCSRGVAPAALSHMLSLSILSSMVPTGSPEYASENRVSSFGFGRFEMGKGASRETRACATCMQRRHVHGEERRGEGKREREK